MQLHRPQEIISPTAETPSGILYHKTKSSSTARLRGITIEIPGQVGHYQCQSPRVWTIAKSDVPLIIHFSGGSDGIQAQIVGRTQDAELSSSPISTVSVCDNGTDAPLASTVYATVVLPSVKLASSPCERDPASQRYPTRFTVTSAEFVVWPHWRYFFCLVNQDANPSSLFRNATF